MNIVIIILVCVMFMCVLRAFLGPTVADRMVAVDILGILVAGLCTLLCIKFERSFLIDIALAWIFLSFIGTIALAKYLEGKRFDE